MVCGDTDTKRRVMLECDRCLGGCHRACCSPPLDDVPEVGGDRVGWGEAGHMATGHCDKTLVERRASAA